MLYVFLLLLFFIGLSIFLFSLGLAAIAPPDWSPGERVTLALTL